MTNKISRRSDHIKDIKKKNKETSKAVHSFKKHLPKEPAKEGASFLAVKKDSEKEKDHKKPFLESYDLPQNYNATNLTLIARDPQWIYAYWEIAPSSMESLKNKLGEECNNALIVLRMYDVTYVDFNGYNANRWFDIEVGPNVNNWYINLWNDNVSYCADLGLRMPDGRFFPFVRSNFVTTPRINPSARSEQIWMEVKNNAPQTPFVETKIYRGKDSLTRHVYGKKKASRINTLTQKPTGRWKKFNLTEDDIRAYYSRLSLPLRDLISERLAKQRKKTGPGNFMLKINRGKIRLEEIINFKNGKKRFIKRMLLGASEEFLFSGASETLINQGSQQNFPKSAHTRNFFFEIGTELIVYGRTEPDAKVRLGDKNIALRNDGTFSLRFALPDGKIPLNFVAISNDESERKEISTAVERTKTKHTL